ncbi:unnamed protein product [Phaedon cochleariae]|uniref:Nicastrin n=1 Tax=Phaedon cochleariae TaxID=80249 RepID=A0A9P0GS05_PHACE|nr:unnamed protein product [Phaedon cochleariae]
MTDVLMKPIMTIMGIFIIHFFIMLQLIGGGNGERTKDQMYEKIDGSSACYRRLNATHQIGCSSNRGGSTGTIHVCDSKRDLNFLLVNGTAFPYIPVLPVKYFNVENLERMIESKKVSGLVLHLNNETLKSLDYFTHDYQCPNPYSSLTDTCNEVSTWNPYGTGLLYRDIPFPIFYIDSYEEVLKMRNCFEKFNNFSYESQSDRSLCSLELKSFMYATTNTPTCRRRSNIITNLNPVKFCDPLGDSNIWASLYPLADGPRRNETKPLKDYKYIIISARLDATSMFDKTSGANSPVTGIVTLLTVAKYLKEILPIEIVREKKTNILFILFNGETYDYIGSQRMLFDMLKGYFPLKGAAEDNILPVIRPENVSLFIEVSQLGNSKDRLFVHHLTKGNEVLGFYEKLVEYGKPLLKFDNVSDSLPPASLHTFMKKIPTFPGLLIADHKHSYSNHFYNSIFDNSTNIGFQYYDVLENDDISIPTDSIQQLIANLSETIGKSVFEEVSQTKYNGVERADVILANELLYCYLEDPNCRVHRAIQRGNKLPKIPFSLYVGVDHVTNFMTSFTSLTLGWLTGVVEKGDVNCTNKPRNYAFKFYNMSKSIVDLNTTLCYKITMNTTEAVSPAFIMPDYNWTSGEFSTWSESTWSEINVRMFLKPSAAHEKMSIAIGCISVIFSFILVYFVKSRSHILFTPPLPTEAPTDC